MLRRVLTVVWRGMLTLGLVLLTVGAAAVGLVVAGLADEELDR